VYGGQAQVGETVDARWNPKALCARIERIHPILRRVHVSNLDFISVIRDESRRALLYLDPPYLRRGQRRLYRYDFETADHVRLRDALKMTPHDWVLSYNDVPEIRALYSWAHIAKVPVSYSINGRRRAHELLICKHDYLAAMPSPFCADHR
jgi:DNA adenine methylase